MLQYIRYHEVHIKGKEKLSPVHIAIDNKVNQDMFIFTSRDVYDVRGDCLYVQASIESIVVCTRNLGYLNINMITTTTTTFTGLVM